MVWIVNHSSQRAMHAQVVVRHETFKTEAEARSVYQSCKTDCYVFWAEMCEQETDPYSHAVRLESFCKTVGEVIS